MPMQKAKRQELRKLREIIRVLLADRRCMFCREPLLNPGVVEIGGTDGSPLTEKLTWHHLDGDHENNERKNLRLVHTSCHKTYHLKALWRTKEFRESVNRMTRRR